jgi:hypothetical protein
LQKQFQSKLDEDMLHNRVIYAYEKSCEEKLGGGIQKQANKLKKLIQNSYKSDSPNDRDGGAYPSSSSSTVVVSMG